MIILNLDYCYYNHTQVEECIQGKLGLKESYCGFLQLENCQCLYVSKVSTTIKSGTILRTIKPMGHLA